MIRMSLFAVLCSLLASLLPAADAADTVEIYADFRPAKFGQAEERAEVKVRGGFDAAKTLSVPDPDGVLTAVVLDARVVDALTSYLTDYHERRIGPAWMWLQEAAGRRIFHYYDDSRGLAFSFSAERPNAAIISLVASAGGRFANIASTCARV